MAAATGGDPELPTTPPPSNRLDNDRVTQAAAAAPRRARAGSRSARARDPETPGSLRCNTCKQLRPAEAFSRNQKRLRPSRRRCATCVYAAVGRLPPAPPPKVQGTAPAPQRRSPNTRPRRLGMLADPSSVGMVVWADWMEHGWPAEVVDPEDFPGVRKDGGADAGLFVRYFDAVAVADGEEVGVGWCSTEVERLDRAALDRRLAAARTMAHCPSGLLGAIESAATFLSKKEETPREKSAAQPHSGRSPHTWTDRTAQVPHATPPARPAQADRSAAPRDQASCHTSSRQAAAKSRSVWQRLLPQWRVRSARRASLAAA